MGDFDIDPLLSRPRAFEGDVAIKDLKRRLSLDPDLVPQPPLPTGWRAATLLRIGALAFVAIALATAGALLLPFPEKPAEPSSRGAAQTTLAHEGLARARTPPRPARLIVENQKGFANEALPLGIALNGGAGDEIVTLSGLANGMELSAGTRVGATRWRVPAHALGNGFAHPPKDFFGGTDIMIDLHTRDEQLLDSQVVRLEWAKRRQDGQIAGDGPAKQAASSLRLDAETNAIIERFIEKGEILSARILLQRAAAAGSAEAALKLGMTFDPAYLAKTGAVGFAGDAAQARAWYERAVELRSAEKSGSRERRAGMGR